MSMLAKVNKTLLEKGDNILVALSGGPDSTALLLLLLKMRRELSLILSVAHVNYNLRGTDSKKDADFVRQLANKYKLPFYSLEVDGKKELKRKGVSLQNKARKIRYEFFISAAKEAGAGKVAVAHNQNDQAETVLMRLFRGSGSAGLSGIPAKRELGEGLILIRPLLTVSREEINAFLLKEGIKARIDRSNSEPIYLRNKIRLKLIPALRKEFNPAVEKNIAETAKQLSLEDEYLSSRALEYIKSAGRGFFIRENAFRKLHAALKPRVLRELIRRSFLDLKGIESKHLNAMLSGKKRISLPGNAVFLRNGGKILVKKSFVSKKNKAVKLSVPGVNAFGVYKVAASFKDMVKYYGGKNEAFLDTFLVKFPVFLRSRKDGDRFMPFGMKTFKKLQDFMTDEKIPVHKRDSLPLVVDNAGNILWVAGYRPDERFRVTKKTQKILYLKVRQLP